MVRGCGRSCDHQEDIEHWPETATARHGTGTNHQSGQIQETQHMKIGRPFSPSCIQQQLTLHHQLNTIHCSHVPCSSHKMQMSLKNNVADINECAAIAIDGWMDGWMAGYIPRGRLAKSWIAVVCSPELETAVSTTK